MNSPQHEHDSLRELKAAYRALDEQCRLSEEGFNNALVGGDFDTARALQAKLEEALDDMREKVEQEYVTIADGRMLLKSQCQGLQTFISENSLDYELILPRITITDGCITEADFGYLGLTSLKGLDSLTTIRTLHLSGNSRLNSLEGVPITQLENLIAESCNLSGNLQALMDAQKIQDLYIRGNFEVTSLSGIPIGQLQWLDASECGLTGGLEELENANKLETLRLSRNPGLDQERATEVISKLRGKKLTDISL